MFFIVLLLFIYEYFHMLYSLYMNIFILLYSNTLFLYLPYLHMSNIVFVLPSTVFILLSSIDVVLTFSIENESTVGHIANTFTKTWRMCCKKHVE